MARQIIRKKAWVIMDKTRAIIAKGVPRNRYLGWTEDDDLGRILTYVSKGKAEAGFKVSGFFMGSGDMLDYIRRTYPAVSGLNYLRREDWVKFLEAVEVEFVILEPKE